MGSVSRYFTTLAVIRISGENLIITDIFIENIAGCLLIGFFFSGIKNKKWFSPDIRILVLTGFTASYTTYSGFGVEAFHLFSGSVVIGLIYMIVQIVTGILAVWTGMIAGNRLSVGK